MSGVAGALPADAEGFMGSILQRIATGPELSKDITREEACAAMRLILDAQVDPVQAGVFLIALRMKRETDEEVCGVLDAIREATRFAVAAVDEVVDIGDPYDGYRRTLPAAPFLPPVLAACGVAAISHGVESMGPKFGVTHRQVLEAAGLPVDLQPEQAAGQVADPSVGWAYVDQRTFCPKLHALTRLRTLIVKRPAITTAEVLAGPIRGRMRTHLVTGYVHKPYPRVYALLARHAGYDSALLVRGIEGGVIPSLINAGKAFHYHSMGAETATEFKPADLGIDQSVRAAPIPGGADGAGESATPFESHTAASAAAQAGLAALAGRSGATRDSLVCGAALCLCHLGRHATLSGAAQAVRRALDSGAALRHLDRMR